jgi:uncharacterized protein (DUF1330 family)
MTVSMCVLLWAGPGQRDALARYEDAVLALLPDHGGRVVRRVPAIPGGGQPDEIQFLEFGSRDGISSFTADPRRTALVGERDVAVARTDIVFLADPLPEPDVVGSEV